MKALVLSMKRYSLTNLIKDGLEQNLVKVKVVDFNEMLPALYNLAYNKSTGFPNNKTRRFRQWYYNQINKTYLKIFELEKPDLVVIYNNQFVNYETISYISRKAKIFFYLGDNPLYSNTFDDNLAILTKSNFTLVPDTHWLFELHSIGMPNLMHDFIGYSENIFYKTNNINQLLKEKYQSNLLFIGRSYPDAAGYKRALFCNSIAKNGLKLFGPDSWRKWFYYFPELQTNFHLQNGRISDEELNLAFNCTKICPIDQNPGLINGIHIRAFETIGSGTLPVMEWRKDIDIVFKDKLPHFKSYSEANEIIEYYLHNDSVRNNKVNELSKHVLMNYTPKLLMSRALDFIFK